MLVVAVIVGLVPYYELNSDTPISSPFSSYGMQWAVYATFFMAMARDGLLPHFFSGIHKGTQISLESTIVTGVFAATIAFFMDVSQLAGMVS
ncbi:hypothetical protein JHK87_027697 [Glycine soja]|nr:hypothetical protein JHK87_027697 [Glycine soja]